MQSVDPTASGQYLTIPTTTMTNTRITTNASKLKVERLAELSGFMRLQIHVSVDATGDLYPYMRGYNYSWVEADAKIKEMYEAQEKYNYKLSLNGTYQIYNMLNLEEFYNWMLQYVDIDYIEHRVLNLIALKH